MCRRPGLEARARKREIARAIRHPTHPRWYRPSRDPEEYLAKESGRKTGRPRRALTVSWSPCIQTVIRGWHRLQGHPSAIRWSRLQRPRPKRILSDNQAERSRRAVGVATAERATSFASVETFFSCNAAGNPSQLIREPARPFSRKTLLRRHFCKNVKRKERPPKDSRPKEKPFRHGGREGRPSTRRKDPSASRDTATRDNSASVARS